MSSWNALKWGGLVVAALVLTVGLARLFSGPEDTWIKDESGQWVAHGHPAGPPPAADYQQPWSERVLPVLLLGAFGAAMLATALWSSRSVATAQNISRSLRFLGGVSMIAGTLAASLGIAIAVTVASELGSAFDQPEVILLILLGLTAFLVLVAANAHVAKKVLEAHYDLRRQAALMQDTVERLREELLGGAGT